MSRDKIRVVVLFEDRAQGSFLRRLVEHLQLTPARYENCNNSSGVLARVRREVETLRSKNYQGNLGLLIVIDADEAGLSARVAELDHLIAQCGGGARGAQERIAYVVPAYEIETWYVHLCFPSARPVDECRDDYKSSPEWRELEKDLGGAARRAVKAWPPEPGRVDPASMSGARRELKRVA